jgi:chromosome partitioning protein
VLGTVDPVTFAVTGTSHFSNMVSDARRQRRVVDHATIDWIVVRNRLSMLGSRNKRLVGEGLQELSLRLGFRAVDGFAERVIFRELYPRGLTALDTLDEGTLGTRPSMSHVTARQEVETLLKSLKLPIDERGMRRAAARQEWFAAQAQPLELPDLLAPETAAG